MNCFLAAGLVLRLMVLVSASPFNPDEHYEVIRYIAEHHRLPVSNELSQSYHPPLYYLLVAPLYGGPENPQAVHVVSFVLSSLNLLLIWWLLRDDLLISDLRTRAIAFAFTCFLPQFVMFSSFISNDTLAALVGTIIFAFCLRYMRAPTIGRLIAAAVSVAVGLLTKGTFILTGPALAMLIAAIESRREWRPAAARIAIFCTIFMVLGCYKYIENIVHHGRPIVHNLDMGGEIFESQRGTWKGPQTLYDINILKLIRRPVLQVRNTFSYPLLMYGTFWYPHIPDSSFEGNRTGYQWVGSIIYAVAIVPTIVFLLGVAQGIWRCFGMFSSARSERDSVSVLCTLLLLSNVAVVIAAGVKYDAWSCFQSRLCFQSMLPGLVLFGRGMEMLPRIRWLRALIGIFSWTTVACCLLYFVVELGLVYGLLMPGSELEP